MTDLPEIQAVNPVTVPPVPERTYPNWFNVLLVIRPAAGNAVVSYRPYNYETKELYEKDDQDISLNIADFWGFVAERPTLAAAMATFTAELAKIAKETELLKALEAAKQAAAADPDNEELQQAVTAAQTAVDEAKQAYQEAQE